MILSGYTEHLLPEGYKRYFHMCMGLVLILMISTPLMHLLKSSGSIDFDYLMEDLKTGSIVYQSDGKAAQNYQAYYLQQYKSALETQIRQIVSEEGLTIRSVAMTVNEAADSSEYGQLEQLTVTVEETDDNALTIQSLREKLSTQAGLAESQIQIQIE
jgi:hypothetical protein